MRAEMKGEMGERREKTSEIEKTTRTRNMLSTNFGISRENILLIGVGDCFQIGRTIGQFRKT